MSDEERILRIAKSLKFLSDYQLSMVEKIVNQLREPFLVMQRLESSEPGYCSIYENQGTRKFQLYFDGGTERKLQIKNLMKNYCTVHADWKFSDLALLE